MEVREIIELMKAVSENSLTSFELKQDDIRLTIKREDVRAAGSPGCGTVVPVTAGAGYGAAVPAAGIAGPGIVVPVAGAAAIPTAGIAGMTAGAELLSGAGILAPQVADAGAVQSASGVSSDQIITCPLVGTFYSSPAPDAESFVKVGDTVKKGQVMGIVEAMKLMNEIESEYDGIVEAVLVKDGETVEYGQPLFRIR